MSSDSGGVARHAKHDDARAIARIYNQGIEDRIATFETEPRSVADIERLLGERADRYPAIVVERYGEVVAWATAGSYRSRPCYDPVAEHSVYVDRRTAVPASDAWRSRHSVLKPNAWAF